MTIPVWRILFLEDLPTDVELSEKELRKNGLEFTSIRVETKEEFTNALTNFHPDLIISDYELPLFNGHVSLETGIRV